MLFSSPEYVFAFLPSVFLVYWTLGKVLPSAFRTLLLLAASLFFYAWWDSKYLILLLASVVVNYLFGRLLRKKTARWILAVAIILNCAPLVFYKYTDFLLSSAATALAWFDVNWSWTPRNLTLPLGISFFTFQQIAYLVDCRRGGVKDYPLHRYALFVTFWPQLIAGPIVQHDDLLPQLENNGIRFKTGHFAVGFYVLCCGLAKKLVIADSLSTIADWGWSRVFAPGGLTSATCWFTTLCYSLQLYFDFSGYCDMAWGAALLFNVRLPINFNSPYKADSIQDFWRRWHMSLSRWLRDYLYFTFGGSRCSLPKTIRNILLTFLIGGLWHGAGWTFVLWGFMHGVALAVNHLWRKLQSHRLPKLLSWALTMFFVHFAWIFFRAPDAASAGAMIRGMFVGGVIAYDWTFSEQWFAYLTLSCALLVLFFPNSIQMGMFFAKKFRHVSWQCCFGLLSAALLFAAVLRMFAKSVSPSPFIYFQF